MSKHLIIVEDDNTHVMLLRRFIKRSDWNPEIEHFGFGTDAVDHFRNNDIPSDAIVLLDINLPDMSGLDILRKIREIDRYTEMSVVVLTTSNLAHEQKVAKSLGVEHYLEKPFSYDKLIQLLVELDVVIA